MAKKPLQCPLHAVEGELQAYLSGSGEGKRCRHRSARIYDVQRHVRKVHGMELGEEEVRVLLRDADAGGK